MEDSIQGQVVQRDIKIMKETMKKSIGGQAETNPNERDKQDNLTRTRSRNPVLTWDLPISKILLLDKAVTD
jgi:hypothetical protein